MKKFLFLLVLFFFVFPVNIWGGGQIIALPGRNCGVPDDPNKRACCYSIIQTFGITEETKAKVEEIPIVILRPALKDILNFIDLQIDNFPFITPIFNLPLIMPIFTDILPIPTLGKLKQAFKDVPACIEGATTNNKAPSDPDCYCINPNPPLYSLLKLCDNVSLKEQEACKNCLKSNGIYTGMFCFKGNFSTFIKETVFSFGIGLAGIIALFCIIYCAFQIQTSQGNAEKIKKAQELLTSCITGLMLIIFSVFILRLIGVDILKIPGFGR